MSDFDNLFATTYVSYVGMNVVTPIPMTICVAIMFSLEKISLRVVPKGGGSLHGSTKLD